MRISRWARRAVAAALGGIAASAPAHHSYAMTFCTEYDRSIEPGSGKQRFDLTPPAGLPPLPPR
jgi:hypothetical protein